MEKAKAESLAEYEKWKNTRKSDARGLRETAQFNLTLRFCCFFCPICCVVLMRATSDSGGGADPGSDGGLHHRQARSTFALDCRRHQNRNPGPTQHRITVLWVSLSMFAGCWLLALTRSCVPLFFFCREGTVNLLVLGVPDAIANGRVRSCASGVS
jgi:hypothetical protein